MGELETQCKPACAVGTEASYLERNQLNKHVADKKYQSHEAPRFPAVDVGFRNSAFYIADCGLVQQKHMKSLFDWSLLWVGVVLSSLGGILLKMGAARIDHAHGISAAAFQAAQEWRLFLGAFCYFIPVIIWIFLLKRVEITLLQPLFALVYITTPVLAIPLLGEYIPVMRWAGIAVIIIGIILVART